MAAEAIHVCAAVITRGDTFLLALRPTGKHLASHWEFPGGKVGSEESLEACIQREIREELGVTVKASRHVCSLEHRYPEKAVHLHFFVCGMDDRSEPRALEHEAVGWFGFEQARELPLAPADRQFLETWMPRIL